MKIDLFDVDKFIQVNKLKEVTNPIIIERDNIPTRDGLLSTEIFGRTVDERKTIFAFVDLHNEFFHPFIYKVLKRLDMRFEKVALGEMFVKINESGEMIEDEEKGQTGLEFITKNIDKIKFKKNESMIRNERIDLLNSLKHSEKCVKQWILCPAFYRDLQLAKADKGKISYGDINKPYSKLISLARALQNDSSGIQVIGNMTRMKIQNLLVEIYDYFTHQIKGKNGMFRQFVLGKSVDYGARVVISAPLFKTDKYHEMPVSFHRCGVPLAIACTNFFPFVVKWVKDYFHNEIYLRKDKFPVLLPDGTIDNVRLLNVEKFNDDYITKNIDLFIHSYADRFKTIPLENDKGYDIKLKVIGRYATAEHTDDPKSSTIINRHVTWTDILYMACVDVTRDKHVLITRYPLEDYFGIFPNKVTVMSTINTIPAVISSREYSNYPVVDIAAPPSKIATMFVDTLNISNLYLKGLGGDYDGDQVSIRGVFSQEANIELAGILNSKKNILNVYGSNVRSTEKEALQTIYSLTKQE